MPSLIADLCAAQHTEVFYQATLALIVV
jgi:hypothetical protein